MIDELTYEAEQRALKAEELKAFSGLNLLHIKRSVEKILDRVNTGGFFTEYTVHSIDHVNSMLDILSWVVPEKTKKDMSPADWLMTVLAIYFHDMGLLITQKEFEERNKSRFKQFVMDNLYSGDDGEDYESKVKSLYENNIEREKFLYQEFVREHHAERIYSWITGRNYRDYGKAEEATSELEDLLSDFDSVFREDLGTICKSHHKDNLGDTDIYGVCKPYGNKEKEEVNLQYSAVLLRTADLLHITRDRAPSVTFRIINPTDPISQREWSKQNAV